MQHLLIKKEEKAKESGILILFHMSVSQGIKTRENNTIDSKSLVKLDLKSKYSGLWGLFLFYFTGYLRLVAGIKMDSLKQNKSLRPVLLTERRKNAFFLSLYVSHCFRICALTNVFMNIFEYFWRSMFPHITTHSLLWRNWPFSIGKFYKYV